MFSPVTGDHVWFTVLGRGHQMLFSLALRLLLGHRDPTSPSASSQSLALVPSRLLREEVAWGRAGAGSAPGSPAWTQVALAQHAGPYAEDINTFSGEGSKRPGHGQRRAGTYWSRPSNILVTFTGKAHFCTEEVFLLTFPSNHRGLQPEEPVFATPTPLGLSPNPLTSGSG